MKKQIFIGLLLIMVVYQLKNIDSSYYFDNGNIVSPPRDEPLPVPPLEEIE